ncbi:hypothetical protein ABPG72_014239 [Tetrahymena utriculariae]
MKSFLKFGSLIGFGAGLLFKGKSVLMDESFKYRKDEYSGIHVTTENQKFDSEEQFRKQVEQFINQRQQEDGDISSIWIKLSPENVYLSHTLNQLGFDVHHSQNQYIMFNKWMNTQKINKIPSYSTHYISCAPVVISEDYHILLQKKGSKWGVPADTLKQTGMKLDNLAQEIVKKSFILQNNQNPNLTFQDLILIREITKTQSGYPDILFAMQYKCDLKYLLINQNDSEYKWVPLDSLALFIRDNQDHIHYPIHYLILERVNTLHEQKKLNVPNPDSKKLDYYFKIFDSHNTVFPML